MKGDEKVMKGAPVGCGRVRMPDGSWRNHGLQAAAEWLGVSGASLTRIIEDPEGNEHSAELNERARREFPGFFPRHTEVPGAR